MSNNFLAGEVLNFYSSILAMFQTIIEANSSTKIVIHSSQDVKASVIDDLSLDENQKIVQISKLNAFLLYSRKIFYLQEEKDDNIDGSNEIKGKIFEYQFNVNLDYANSLEPVSFPINVSYNKIKKKN